MRVSDNTRKEDSTAGPGGSPGVLTCGLSHPNDAPLSNPESGRGQRVERVRYLAGVEAAPRVRRGPRGRRQGAQAVDRGAVSGQGERSPSADRGAGRRGPATAGDTGGGRGYVRVGQHRGVE